MKKPILYLLALGGFAGYARAEAPEASKAPRPVDIAFCIDLSGSMETALPRVRQAIPLMLEKLREERKGAVIRAAITAYAHQEKMTGLLDFTSDDEKINQTLAQARTYSTLYEEHAGQALDFTARRLSWSRSADTDRQIVLIGNETLDQTLSPRPVASSHWWRVGRVVPELRQKGFVVHAVYCPTLEDTRRSGYFPGAYPLKKVTTPKPEGLAPTTKDEVLVSLNGKTSWVELAELGGGKFGQLNARPTLPLLSLLPPTEFRGLLRRILQEDQVSAGQLEIKAEDTRL